MTSNSKFYRDLSLVVLLCAVCAWLAASYILHSAVPVSFWLSLIFIGLITFLVHKVLVSANAKRPQIFVAYFMGALTGKLLLSAMILLIVGLTDRTHLKFTGIGFFIAYALLTTVELVHLLPLIRNSKS